MLSDSSSDEKPQQKKSSQTSKKGLSQVSQKGSKQSSQNESIVIPEVEEQVDETDGERTEAESVVNSSAAKNVLQSQRARSETMNPDTGSSSVTVQK